MCESTVFVRREGTETLLAEDVARVLPQGEEVSVVTLLGEEHRVTGHIAEIDLMAHRIVLESRAD